MVLLIFFFSHKTKASSSKQIQLLNQLTNMPTVFQGKLSENLKFGHILEISGQAEENGYW